MSFVYDYKHIKGDFPSAYWFIFYKDAVLVEEGNGSLRIPFIADMRNTGLQPEDVEYIGSMDGRDCYAASVRDSLALTDCSYQKLLPSFALMDETWFWLAGRAYHLLGWSQRTRFCSVCGSRMEPVPEERARQCTGCSSRVYPRISPAVIVAVTHGDKLLLARAARFTGKMHSVIAGFVEPGETLEACVRREVKEEVGIEVANVRYFSSQPWPFPDSLMIAFTAEYAGGTLTVDNREIVEAGWYGAHELPEIPGKASVARKLIDWFCGKK